MSSKGVFTKPRSAGKVKEIRVKVARVQFSEGKYALKATVEEGKILKGTFVEIKSGKIGILESDLSDEDQVAFDNFLRVVLSLYIDDKGYSGVVIS